MSQTFTLPYTFDNRMTHRWSLIGLWASIPLTAACYIFISIFAPLDPDGMMMLQVFVPIMAISSAFAGYWLFKRSPSARGTISSNLITVEADIFLGLSSNAVSGTYISKHFEGIDLRRVTINHSKMGLVWLIGHNAQHTIKLNGLPVNQAEELAALFSRELNLPMVAK